MDHKTLTSTQNSQQMEWGFAIHMVSALKLVFLLSHYTSLKWNKFNFKMDASPKVARMKLQESFSLPSDIFLFLPGARKARILLEEPISLKHADFSK